MKNFRSRLDDINQIYIEALNQLRLEKRCTPYFDETFRAFIERLKINSNELADAHMHDYQNNEGVQP